jgi:hypothetical protein
MYYVICFAAFAICKCLLFYRHRENIKLLPRDSGLLQLSPTGATRWRRFAICAKRFKKLKHELQIRASCLI